MSLPGRLALLMLVAAVAAAAGPARAQDLDAGKSGERLFAANCTACHRSPRGLAKRNRISLFYFLREHYTSSQASAGALAAYLAAMSAETTRTKPKSTAAGPHQTAIGRPSAPSASGPSPPTRDRSATPPRPPTDVPSR